MAAISTRSLFLLDGVGAVVSALMLGLVLPAFHEYIGLPVSILRLLGAVALLPAFYSLTCYRRDAGARWLGPIAIANVVYCMVTFVILLAHQDSVTSLGMLYFIMEMAIILVLAFVEKKRSAME